MIALFLKAALVVLCVALFLLVMALTRGMYRLWPTSFGDKKLEITTSTIDDLRAFRSDSKFLPDMASFYPGAPNEAVRLGAERELNRLLDRLVEGLPAKPHKAFVLANIKATLAAFNSADSEERDRVGLYIEKIMQITGVKESGELLNVWRYGLPIGWFKRKT